MARVTIEDCRRHISNRFELVILASQRAKDLSLGIPPLIQKTRDKDAVLALREIAAGAIDPAKLREFVISKNVDPMKRDIRAINQSIELEDIFKDLAASVESDNQDGYEHDEILENDECCAHHTAQEDAEFYDEQGDEDEDHKHIKQQEFDIDVAFVDEEIED